MAGKILKIDSNDLYGNVDDRTVSVFAAFNHIKYMNNYVIFVINENNNKKKLLYGSVHLKKNSLVIFNVKDNVKQYIELFLDEYLSDKLSNFKLLDISKFQKVELVSYNEMEYDKVDILDNKAIPKIIVNEEVVKEKTPILLYLVIILLVLLALGLSILYFKPELFAVKYNVLKCNNNIYDNNINLYYDIDKEITFDENDYVSKISVVRTYTFLDSISFQEFKNNDRHNQYFINGEGYKYIDNELQFKVFYEENTVIDDYDEMLTYLKREGYRCIVRVYEK